MTIYLPDGVHIGLHEDHYFSQPRLGSTDLVRLHRSPADWWYSSPHNPDRDEGEGSEERDFGKALHALLLEGEDAFAESIAISPYDSFRTREAQIWRDEMKIRGRAILSGDQVRRVRHMAALIANHPELGPPLGAGLSEVTVLFKLGDEPMRARFDKLLPHFVVDLKTFGGHTRGRDTKDKALRLVAERDYDVQRYVYDRAREALCELVAAGKVYGANAEQRAWLEKVANVTDWSWTWIFYQRRDDRQGRAPIVQPVERPRFDVTFDTGRRKAETALSNYRAYVSRFGFETPWALIEPLWRPLDHDFPTWLGDVADPQFSEEGRP